MLRTKIAESERGMRLREELITYLSRSLRQICNQARAVFAGRVFVEIDYVYNSTGCIGEERSVIVEEQQPINPIVQILTLGLLGKRKRKILTISFWSIQQDLYLASIHVFDSRALELVEASIAGGKPSGEIRIKITPHHGRHFNESIMYVYEESLAS
jgi:hypothetical protein